MKVLDAIESRRATMFVGVPAMYRMLDEAGAAERDLTSVRVWASGADAMPPELAERFKKMGATITVPLLGAVGQAAFAEGYGMVEVGGGVAAKLSPPFLGAGSGPFGEALGFALPGYEMRVVDDDGDELPGGQVGELQVKGPGVLKALLGRRGRPPPRCSPTTAGSAPATWPARARSGLLVFEGRSKHVIKHGGYSVYALEVEQALEQHPDVLEASVVGLPDERLGEVPGRGRPPRRGRHARSRPSSRPGPRSAWPTTRCRSASSPSTSCPAPAPTRSRRPSSLALFD